MLINKNEVFDMFITTEKISYDEFKEKVTFQSGKEYINYKTYIAKLKEDDERINEDYFLKTLYYTFVEKRDDFVETFYNCVIDVDLKDLKFDYNTPIYNKETKLYKGSIQKDKTRAIKGLFFEHIFGTSFNKDNPTLPFIVGIKESLNEYKFNTNLIINSTLKVLYNIRIGNVKDENMTKDNTLSNFIWYYLSIGGKKLSTFNPYTALGILHSFNCKNVVTPVLDWGSYLLAFMNSNYEEYVGIDVIPDVIEKCNLIANSKVFKNKKGGLRKKKDDKTVDLYCCPSEELDERFNFSEKYNEHFELSFCSPPYFDLEVYDEDNQDQSHNKFNNLDEWLVGYWEATVKIIKKTLKKDGYFTFVISDSSATKENDSISNKMLEICKKHLTYVETRKINWTTNTKIASKFEEGNFENLFVLKKD